MAALAFFFAAPADAAKKKPRRSPPPIAISGTVYSYDDQKPIAGATVRVAELPALSTVSGLDGSYSLTIPDGREFTPYADAAGYHRVYLQTWVSQRRNMRGVNVQMPTSQAFGQLAGALGAPRGPDGELSECAVLSTLSKQAVRDLPFSQFIAAGPPGVAGAVAGGFFSDLRPTYFNEQGVPDQSLTMSTTDGRVAWPVLPSGPRNFLGGINRKLAFASFRANCEPGRLINAAPAQGLYELRSGEEVDLNVDAETRTSTPGPFQRRPRVEVEVRAREYVRVTVELYARKKLIRKRVERKWSPGTRRLSFPVTRKQVIGANSVVVSVVDAEGNGRSSESGSSKIIRG